jgi:hypothetical protein
MNTWLPKVGDRVTSAYRDVGVGTIVELPRVRAGGEIGWAKVCWDATGHTGSNRLSNLRKVEAAETEPPPKLEPPRESAPPKPNALEIWARLELMGHVSLYGRVSEEERFGQKIGRIDIPKGDGEDDYTTQYFGAGSLYRLTPCTEETAREFAGYRPRRIGTYAYAPPTSPSDDVAEGDWNDDQPEDEEAMSE